MSVSDVVQNFKNIERSRNCYIYPNIPAKKLKKCKEAFCFSGEKVDFLLDDTVWGSAKDGMAISNSSLYYKQMGEGAKRIDLSSVGKFTCEKRSLGNIELFSDGMPFLTISGFDKAYHDILMDLLNASAAEARSMKQSRSEAAEVTTSDTPASKPLTSTEAEIVCAGCDARMPAGAKFCPECGTKVPAKGICGECNEELPEAAKFCPKCGASSGVQKAPVEPAANLNALREFADDGGTSDEDNSPVNSSGKGVERAGMKNDRYANLADAFYGYEDAVLEKSILYEVAPASMLGVQLKPEIYDDDGIERMKVTIVVELSEEENVDEDGLEAISDTVSDYVYSIGLREKLAELGYDEDYIDWWPVKFANENTTGDR